MYTKTYPSRVRSVSNFLCLGINHFKPSGLNSGMLNPWTISQSTYGGFGVSPDHSGMSPNSTPHRRDSLNSDPHRIHQNHFKQNNFMYHGVNSNINSPQPGWYSAQEWSLVALAVTSLNDSMKWDDFRFNVRPPTTVYS